MTISVVVPVYRGGRSISLLFDRVQRATAGSSRQFLFVCDGCDSISMQTVENLSPDKGDTIEIINLEQNLGQQAATLKGLARVKGDYVVTLDDDMQHSPEHIAEMITHLTATNSDVVYARFRNLKSPPLRKAGSYIVRRISRMLFREIYPWYSPFRLMRREVALKLAGINSGALFIDLMLPSVTERISHIVCAHSERGYGKSGYSLIKLFRLIIVAYRTGHYKEPDADTLQ